jgi:hypothetical protein
LATARGLSIDQVQFDAADLTQAHVVLVAANMSERAQSWVVELTREDQGEWSVRRAHAAATATAPRR